MMMTLPRPKTSGGDAAALPAVQQKPPLEMPRASNLRDVLGLSPDLMRVRGVDMMRKATDELTLGLSWHVLYTLAHSRKDGCKRPIEFTCSNLQHRDGQMVKQGRRRRVIVDMNSASKARQGFNEFNTSVSGNEARTLLRHVAYVGNQTRYYAQGCSACSRLLQRLINYIFHRNFILSRTSVEDVGEITDRFFRAVKAFINCLNGNAASPHGWAGKACKQLRDAAHSHFKNVLDISRYYDCLKRSVRSSGAFDSHRMDDQNDTPCSQCAQALDILQTLSPRSSALEIVALMISARFGLPESEVSTTESPETASVEEDLDVAGNRGPPKTSRTMRLKSVRRFKVLKKPSRLEVENFVIPKQADFLIDPLSASHLDMTNRLLDIASACIHQIIVRSGETMFEKQGPSAAQHKFLHYLMTLHAPKYGPDGAVEKQGTVQFRYTPANIHSVRAVMYEQRRLQSEEPLFSDPTQATKPKEAFLNYLRSTAQFCDPFFLGKLLEQQHNGPNAGAIPDGDVLLKIVTCASHQAQLHSMQQRGRDLQTHVVDVIDLVNKLSVGLNTSGTGRPATEWLQRQPTFLALQELRDLLPYYRRFRSRQHNFLRLATAEDIQAPAPTGDNHDPATARNIRQPSLATSASGSPKARPRPSFRLQIETCLQRWARHQPKARQVVDGPTSVETLHFLLGTVADIGRRPASRNNITTGGASRSRKDSSRSKPFGTFSALLGSDDSSDSESD